LPSRRVVPHSLWSHEAAEQSRSVFRPMFTGGTWRGSLILPELRLCSLPIPSRGEPFNYAEVQVFGGSAAAILSDLRPAGTSPTTNPPPRRSHHASVTAAVLRNK